MDANERPLDKAVSSASMISPKASSRSTTATDSSLCLCNDVVTTGSEGPTGNETDESQRKMIQLMRRKTKSHRTYLQ